MSFLGQLSASGVGGAIRGSFVLSGINAQFRSRRQAALRALTVEVGLNTAFSVNMVENIRAYPAQTGFIDRYPNPGWLKKWVWTSQLTAPLLQSSARSGSP
jgi:hypothetical protein